MEFPVIIVPKGDSRYPRRLTEISDPPKVLYCRGNIELLSRDCLAVVGTRKLTGYGREACQTITNELARAGFTIVSGLAFGIDAIAHQSTLDVDGKTIAVLGGSVEDKEIGPKTNLPLAKKILKNGGLLVSEYKAGSRVFATNFAVRDRIISGLSLGVLVIEADLKSGSLITAKCALEQNRDVFAVPGSIFSSRSSGSNELIKNGAKLVRSAKDVIEEYGNNLSLLNRAGNNLSTTDPVQKAILDILKARGEASIDALISELGKNPSEIMTAVSMLELTGLIVRLSNGKYRRK